MTDPPTLFLTVGLPGTGKTTAAKRLERERPAMRVTKDEWMKALFGADNPSAASDVVEGRLIDIALRALELGVDAIIDFGLWSRDERSALRSAAAERGASAEVLFFDVPQDEQRRRLDARLAAEPHTTWPISDHELATWPSWFDVPSPEELDGTLPIGEPADGCATWSEWRHRRWPVALHEHP